MSDAFNADMPFDQFTIERLRGILVVAAADRSQRDSDVLLDYYIDRFAEPAGRAARQRVKETKHAEQVLRQSIPTVLVMQEMAEPRDTHLPERGKYDVLGEAVQPGVPTAAAPWPGWVVRRWHGC